MDADEVRREVKSWLAAAWDPDCAVRDWWARMYHAGWSFPRWPEGFGGRGLPATLSRVVGEEFAAADALGPPYGVAQTHGAPVVLRHGSAEQQQRLVPAVGLGLETWCQLFSEPGAGSDLAAIRTRAVRDRTEWVISGQKVWTSLAHAATRGLLLCRTDADSSRHRGLSMFVIDINQPGIEVRPLRQMNGDNTYFNEVFLDGARTADSDLIGGQGNGWTVALSMLELERGGNDALTPGLVVASPGEWYGQLDRRSGDVVKEGGASAPYVAHRRYVNVQRLSELASQFGVDRDPVVRQELARLFAMLTSLDWLDGRAKSLAERQQAIGVEANLVKLGRTRAGRLAQRLAGQILGAHLLLDGDDAPRDGALADLVMSVPSFSIAGGTDEVQRNIVSERGLGLPRGR